MRGLCKEVCQCQGDYITTIIEVVHSYYVTQKDYAMCEFMGVRRLKGIYETEASRAKVKIYVHDEIVGGDMRWSIDHNPCLGKNYYMNMMRIVCDHYVLWIDCIVCESVGPGFLKDGYVLEANRVNAKIHVPNELVCHDENGDMNHNYGAEMCNVEGNTTSPLRGGMQQPTEQSTQPWTWEQPQEMQAG